MTTSSDTQSALSHVEDLLADAPAHVRQRWGEVQAYLHATAGPDAEEIAGAVEHEGDLLDQVKVSANMFSGADRRIEITVEFPFDVRAWFDGHSNFAFEPATSGRSENDRMLDFYGRQEAERMRLLALLRSSVAPIAFDCLRRMVGRDDREGADRTLHDLRHAVWRSGGRSGPEPRPTAIRREERYAGDGTTT